MSFFDVHFTSEQTKYKEFFKKFSHHEEKDLINSNVLFSCPIIYWKDNGEAVSAIIKIMDAKFVIFKVSFLIFFNTKLKIF